MLPLPHDRRWAIQEGHGRPVLPIGASIASYEWLSLRSNARRIGRRPSTSLIS